MSNGNPVYGYRNKEFPCNAQTAGEELERLRQESDGEIIPSSVVDLARAEDHPLHDCFEWDDSAAAELHRQGQARELVRSVVVLVRHQDQPVQKQRVFVSIRKDDGQRSYLPMQQVLSDHDLRIRFLQDALQSLRGLQSRFEDLPEVLPFLRSAEGEVAAQIERIKDEKATQDRRDERRRRRGGNGSK